MIQEEIPEGNQEGVKDPHLDRALVIRVGDTQVLRVNVHQLELKVRDPVGLLVLEHEGHRVRRLVRLERHNVVVVAALQHLP